MNGRSTLTQAATFVDYCGVFAEAVRACLIDGPLELGGESFAAERVFSDANPGREWTGAPTVEFSETNRERKFYLDGTCRDVADVSCLIRTTGRAAAVEACATFKESVVAPTLRRLVASGTIDDYRFGDAGVEPDVRGLAIGGSYFGFVDFSAIGKRFFWED